MLLLVMSSAADEKVVFESDEHAQSTLMAYKWECEWKDSGASGTSEAICQKVKLKGMVANVKSSYCPNGWGRFKGK